MVKKRRDRHTHLKVDLVTQENGMEAIEMDLVSKCGRMEHIMKGIGGRIELMEKESLSMWMETSTKGIGLMIKQTVMESTFTSMVPGMQVNGQMICKMEKERKHGQMDQYMKGTIFWARNRGTGNTVGKMDRYMKANGLKIKLRGMAHIPG
eukprot:CAMPEP_0170553492 /NCGR_PEP_ID=MMETSP0211-20121228/11320_1 /TAXON_ID=311385 /ORGANISM="Pseudokeronopsis sp., Strain OXSARD2" /LENGTH=150 /DNA_ID=CAMNT_0010861861 /DNA_START=251 /DNA_END=703 /DNA_ORIENTATION=-